MSAWARSPKIQKIQFWAENSYCVLCCQSVLERGIVRLAGPRVPRLPRLPWLVPGGRNARAFENVNGLAGQSSQADNALTVLQKDRCYLT